MLTWVGKRPVQRLVWYGPGALSLTELLTVIAGFADGRQRNACWPTTTAPNDWVPNDWVTMLVAVAGKDAEQDIDRLRSARNGWVVESVSG